MLLRPKWASAAGWGGRCSAGNATTLGIPLALILKKSGSSMSGQKPGIKNPDSMSSISPEIFNSCRACTAKCCRGLAVVLTIPEAKRMVAELGLPPEDFLEFSVNVDSKLTPHYPLLVQEEGKVHEYFIILKRRQKRDCIFLQDDLKCGIYNNRPHVCRLYPFELDGGKMKKGALCPVVFEKEEGTEGIADQLKRDLLLHGKIAREWTIRFGKQAPDMAKFGEYFGK